MEQIQKIVNDKVQAMVDDGSIQNKIEVGIEAAIESAISQQFQSYGGITKQIEDALKDGLKINIKDLPFESYNEQMLVAVKARLGVLFQGAASERFMAEMDKLLATPPKEMHIREFVETIVGMWKEDIYYDSDGYDEYATVEVETELEHGLSGVTLKMWKKKMGAYSSNQADIHLYIIDGAIRISHRQSYNTTCFESSEAFIFKLYAAGTIITGIEDFDPDDCDLTLKENEY